MSSRKKQSRSQYVDYGGKTDKYTWDQDENEVNITFPLDKTIRARDIQCTIRALTLKLVVKGKTLLDGPLCHEVLPEGCTWTMESESGNLDVLLAKPKHTENPVWWKCIVLGEPEIDVEAIEASKYLDDSILRKIKAQKVEKAKQDAAAAAAAAAVSGNSDGLEAGGNGNVEIGGSPSAAADDGAVDGARVDE